MPVRPPRPLSAVCSRTCVRAGTRATYREVGFTPLASFLGLPAITFPVGRDAERGAPLAVQLVGSPHADATLIQLAADIARGVGDLGFVPR
jgi:Asp-tRNA(Asn)/Glu-tRNA(Gln) amidotransferase A subunit family amidase